MWKERMNEFENVLKDDSPSDSDDAASLDDYRPISPSEDSDAESEPNDAPIEPIYLRHPVENHNPSLPPSRRNAPLTAENASRIVDAMRGVSFGGIAPDWVDRMPEDRLIDRLRRLRGSG
ncbi:hypothetical protein QJS10_CPB20g00224 [Acorus calamus]|uniref:Uncharacterized protein n=1 Tax=Acorus calamus TaxID=4465 RepID=A0AAV9CB47_ACOCL|nr:hypothetical protein QJS10_CPB20g00224 [Acorus calamus]